MPEAILIGEEPFDTPPRDADAIAAEEFTVAVDGYEGPLDLLLSMARTQKVDLSKISVLKLAEQFLDFVERARTLRIELAADYLVMAAWLAFLKSRLLLPVAEEDGGPTGEEMAAHLAFQLERLEAMRRMAARLMGRDQLGRDFFARGMPETPTVHRTTTMQCSLADLLKAYAGVRTRDEYRPVAIEKREVLSIEAAFERLRSLMGTAVDWRALIVFLPDGWNDAPSKRRSAIASTFAASLELAKQGEIDLSQDGVFAPIYMRRRGAA